MKLTSIRVSNIRCLEDTTINVRNFTSFIGPNNCGKSSVLRATEIFLNQQSPGVEEWRNGHQHEPITITGEFDSIQEWERKTPGIAGIVNADKIKLRLTLSINPSTEKIEKVYEAFKSQENIVGWGEKWAELSDGIKAVATEIGVTSASWKGAAAKEQLREKIRESQPQLVTYLAPQWTSENISIDAALQQAMPQAQLIPAVKNASDDSKPGAKTSFGLLLSKIILPAIQSSSEYMKLIQAVEELKLKLAAQDGQQIAELGELTKLLSERLSSTIDAKVLLTMETPNAEKFIGANTGIALDDGTRTPIELQGNGLQRSLVFALMEVLASQKARIENAAQELLHSRSTILLFEEPELFLHPHIMRRLRDALHLISGKCDWQVIVTTHSPFLIDIGTDPMSLVVFKRANAQAAPTIAQLTQEPFGLDAESQSDREALRAVLDFHPTVCEAFFAKRTILVEGDSEMALLVHQPKLYTKAGVDLAERAHCTVVSCGGKWTIAPIANLLKQFNIPFRVIHDEDKKGRSDEELKLAKAFDPHNANARIARFADASNIFIVKDTLEDLFGDNRSQSSRDKPYNVWKRVKAIVEDDQALPDGIKDLVRFAFCWQSPVTKQNYEAATPLVVPE